LFWFEPAWPSQVVRIIHSQIYIATVVLQKM
jgi:hypothetical protein